MKYYVVICTRAYHAPFGNRCCVIFQKGEVYQAERRGDEFRVWRSNTGFFKFSPSRFDEFFTIFC